jgi:hypothetical protein
MKAFILTKSFLDKIVYDGHWEFSSSEVEFIEHMAVEIKKLYCYATIVYRAKKYHELCEDLDVVRQNHIYPPYENGLYSDAIKAKDIEAYHDNASTYDYHRAYACYKRYESFYILSHTPVPDESDRMPDVFRAKVKELNDLLLTILESPWEHPYANEWMEYLQKSGDSYIEPVGEMP